MMYHFNVTGPDRKRLVETISAHLRKKAVYQGMPTASYQIGDYNISKDGTLTYGDMLDADPEQLDKNITLVQAIEAAGFTCEEWQNAADQEASMTELALERAAEAGYEVEVTTTEEGSGTGLEIQIPLEDVAVGNLLKILEAKGSLIKKALGIDDVSVSIREDCVGFAWFDTVPDSETVDAYTRFISALCEMSVKQKRINAKEKEVDNEKYAFRCFLLRLGFVGDEYKKARKILLKNLTGSAAFKSGAKKGGEQA